MLAVAGYVGGFGRPARWTALLAAVLMAAAAFSFFIYFERANTSFFNRAVSAADLPAELTRWASWHWGRTAASLGALCAALLSFARVG